MSKPVKNLIVESYKKRFEGLNGGVVVDIRGINSNQTNSLRADLAKKHIKITVVKNSLARKAFEAGELAPLNDLLDGPSAMVYPVSEDASVVSVARELIEAAKTLKSMQFRGALMEGIVFGPNQIEALSKYPTKEEAQAQVVQILLTPAQNLVGAITGPGKKVASIIKAIQEKLEKGEEIKKAS
ncbi:MAG: 50S ribosomal protein L10 [Phycisphaeraceae bacterium]